MSIVKKLLPWLLLLFCGVGYAQSNWTPSLPLCLPKVQIGSEVDGLIPTQTPAVSDRYSNYVVWVCALPYGYQTYVDLFNPEPTTLTVIWNYIKGNWTLAQAQVDCLKSCVQPTASEAKYQQVLIAQYRPRALVAFNGANTTRSVFTTNVDGTLNPTPVAGESVSVAAPCDETNRIPVQQGVAITPQGYYSVVGQSNATTGTTAPSILPAGTYAVCAVSFPLQPN